ncbi:TetR/AcrR family transcriptional regulator, partial [Pseudothermotoga lettingae]
MRRQPKRSDGKKTLSNLLNSATRLFADRGYYGVSIPMIAREANVKNATFYQYFKDKESIYRKILEDSFNKFFNLMIKIDGRDTEEILESFLMNYLAFFSRNRQHYRILHEAVYLRKATFRRVEKTLNEVLHR